MNIAPKIWLYRGMFVALSLLMIAIPLLPLNFSPSRIATPDLLLCVIIAWIIRRPSSAPLILVAALALLGDAVLMRPMGLWAMLVIIVSEAVRFSAKTIRERGLLFEFIVVGLSLVAMTLTQNLILFLTLATPYPFVRLVQLNMITLICYPFIVALLYYLFRVRAPSLKGLPDRLGKIR